MDLSTLIVLGIAILIIVYRVKTWNETKIDTQEDDSKAQSVKETVIETPIVKEPKPASKEKKTTTAKKPAAKKVKETVASSSYKKSFKKGVAKNECLVSMVSNPQQTLQAQAFKAQPKTGVTTYIALVTPSEEDRATGVILEKSKSKLTLVKSFDVKMSPTKQFKIATTFSKSQAVSADKMQEETFEITHYLGHDDVTYALEEVSLSLS